MKSILYALMLSVAAGAVLPAHAASFIQVTGGEQPVSPTLISVQQAAVMESGAMQPPLRLVPAKVQCLPGEALKACSVRVNAAQRAAEVIAKEEVAPRMTPLATLSLLVPPSEEAAAETVSTIRVAAAPPPRVPCDPNITVAACERLNRVPSVPQAPSVPAAPDPNMTKPPAVTPPIVADPPSVIPAPRTGDREMVKKPPVTDTDMPVIKPKPNPPVNPQPAH